MGDVASHASWRARFSPHQPTLAGEMWIGAALMTARQRLGRRTNSAVHLLLAASGDDSRAIFGSSIHFLATSSAYSPRPLALCGTVRASFVPMFAYVEEKWKRGIAHNFW